MKRRRANAKHRRGVKRRPPAHEWVGGRIIAPFFVDDRSPPYRPGIALWIELPDGLVVGHGTFMPEETEGAVARTLRGALPKM